MGSARHGPVRLAVVSDFELVVAGVEAMLAAHGDRVVVVELAAQVSMAPNVDVVLWDPRARRAGGGLELRRLAGPGAALVAFGWTADPASEGPASTRDVACYLWKGLTGLELVEALEAVCERRTVGNNDRGRGDMSGHRLGIEQGLTRREAEMLGLIARGLSNQEIADAVFLSINSVKTHIRTAYRKLGV
ncbi:MAG TPA: response regulator transcription factor, partial [Jiangellaceae bacterium]|nr:response regulator transcription factor [Jiangellaceae bacterium]